MKICSRHLPASLLCAFAGCSTVVVPEPIATPAVSAQFKEPEGRWASVAPADVQERGTWWLCFGDTTLTSLIEAGNDGSPSIEIARARLLEARALAGLTEARRRPQAELQASGSRATSSPLFGGNDPANLFGAGIAASYELDFFGKLTDASHAAQLDVEARSALLRNAQLLAQAEIAGLYFRIRTLDAERLLMNQTIEAYRSTLRLTKQRFTAGEVSETDVTRIQAEVSSTESQAFALDRERATLEHALAVLTGQSPTAFSLAEQPWTGVVPRIPTGVPSAMLARRPDVAAAQRSLEAAKQRIGIARKAWFPDVTLSANGGYSATRTDELLRWSSRAWGIGALLSLPLVDGGRRDATVLRAGAEWDAAAASYRAVVLGAVRDVEDQLSGLRTLSDQDEAQAAAVLAASRSTELYMARYRNGYVSLLELLDARRSELANRRQALEVHGAQYQAAVGLVKALGGDWNT